MSKIDFRQNETMGLGVEIEIQLIDPRTADLTPVGLKTLEAIKQKTASERIKSEIFQSMLEIDTPICKNAIEVGESLRQSLGVVRSAAAEFGAQVVMSGTHPFANYTERLVTPSGRYNKLVDRNQWIARRLQVFGLHIHMGMKNGDHAIALSNALCHYLPVVLAFSASSPYWRGEDTGLASSRITVFEAIPTGGHPYLIHSWSDFEDLIEKLTFSKSITSLKDLWWDIRPNPDYGTVEVRIADCPPTIHEAEALVAFTHCLACHLSEEIMSGRKFLPPPEWILRENKWRASRHGVNADLITDFKGQSKSLHEVWSDLKTMLNKQTQALDYNSQFHFLDEILSKGPSYLRQRKAYRENAQSVVQHLVRETQSDQPEWSNS
jgi:carboxylate-amine ligase